MINIVVRKKASRDLDEIKKYISRDSKFYANKTIADIYSKIDNLIYFPYMGRCVPEFNSKMIRELIYKSYRILYMVDSQCVYILRVYHHSRNISNLKF